MSSLRSTFSKFIELGLILTVLSLALVFYFADQKIRALSAASNLVAHTQTMRLELSQIDARVYESATIQRRFMVTDDSAFLFGKAPLRDSIKTGLQHLNSLIGDNAVQKRNLDSLTQRINTHFDLLQVTTWPDFLNRSVTWEKGVGNMDSIQLLLQQMNRLESITLENHQDIRDQLLRTAPVFALLLLLIAIIIAVTSYWRIKNDLRESKKQVQIHLENTKKITELNLALRHAEQLSHSGNWQMDLATGQRQYSDNLYQLFGHEPGVFQAGASDWLQMIHPEDQQLVRDFGDLAQKRQQEPASIVFRLYRPDGEMRYLYAGGKIINTEEGEATLIGTLQDVTESYQLRRQLEERTRFAEMLIESSVDMIAAYDQDLRYTVWNKQCEELLNLKKQDVLGKLASEVFPTVNTEALDRALNGESVHIPPRKSAISNHYYESYALPLRDAAGKVNGVLTITHDITESYTLRSQLEDRSRFAETIIESSVDMLITYDTDLRVTVWNKKSEEIFQRTKAEALGHHVEELFPYITNTERMKDLQSVLDGQAMQYPPHELSPFGIHANLYLLPLKNSTGEVTGVLSITHDVSDVVQSAARLAALNQSLEEKNKQLANINAELASFSYVASHDLQEPLRKIQSFASRILATEKDRLSETGQDAFRRMQSAADRMQQLIEDLLTYSRTNTQTGEFSTVDLNKIFYEAEQEVSEIVQETGAVIEADPLPEVRVVAFQFRQLLANLLSNALKYQRPGVVPHIRITCATVAGEDVPQPDAAGKNYFKMEVIDNGIGFEQQYSERIFELFQRLHGRSEYKGTGIGLAICRKIMQNHNGYLLAEGRPGEGATFTIYLPL